MISARPQQVLNKAAGHRLRAVGGTASLLLAASLVGVGTASAAAVSATVPGVSSGAQVEAAQRIRTVTTTFDSVTGTWTAAVRFRAPQTEATAADLLLSLSAVGSAANRGGWLLRTDPDDLGSSYTPWKPPVLGFEPAVESGFDVTRTILTLRAVDPQLVGIEPDVVRAELGAAGKALSRASAFLGPTAPRPTVPKAARRLTVRHGVVRVPLASLSRPAERFVRIYTPSGVRLAVGHLGAKDYRRRAIELQVARRDLRRLSSRFRPAVLTVRAQLPNASQAVVKRTVRLRRA